MRHAYCIINGVGKLVDAEKDIDSGEVSIESLRDHNCFCSNCGGQAKFVNDPHKKYFFSAYHEPDCDVITDGLRHRIHRVSVDTQIDDPRTIREYEDHAPTMRGEPGNPPGIDPPTPPDVDPDIDDIDRENRYGVKCIHTVKGIYLYTLKHGLDADLGNGLTGADLLLTREATRAVRRRGGGALGQRIAVTKRCSPSSLRHPIDVPDGYVCLVDAFTDNAEEGVFFLVKLAHAAQNTLFRNKVVSSDPQEKDPHRNILLLGEWEVYPNNYYPIYIDDINSRCYGFVNYRDPE